jgi:hypothetical protein
MRPRARLFARLLALAMLGISAVLTLSVWDQTGRLPDTRAPSAALAAMTTPTPADEDVFAGLGMDDAAGKPKEVQNHFRLGLIPGMSSTRDMAAVSTLMLPPLVLTVVVFVATRKPKGCCKKDPASC